MSTLRHRLLDVAESHDLLPKLLGVLSNIAADKTTNAADRITAVKTIFEFCLGKPSEGIDLLLELDEIAADIIDGRLDAGVLDTSALVRQGLPVSSSED
ncbi:MAG: hypothetical protein KDA20_00225 [Phycisphaerales bacterium]|nr:hypothetical protein [Phycisphaerales bacterium]